MTTHYWGDEDFDWNALNSAISEGGRIMRKYGRVGVHSKEKYGTARWSLFLFDGSLHSFTHPGYVYSQYPKWLWRLNCHYRLSFLCPIINWWQVKVIQYAFNSICTKYPHIVKEIVEDAPKGLLPPHLELIRASLWRTSE